MDKMAEAYISLAALPAPDKANEMPFPSSLRRSTKLFDKVLCLTFSHSSVCAQMAGLWDASSMPCA